jgi:hypothetical protein
VIPTGRGVAGGCDVVRAICDQVPNSGANATIAALQ